MPERTMSASHFLKLPRLMMKMLKSEKSESIKRYQIVYKTYFALHTRIGALIPAVAWYQACIIFEGNVVRSRVRTKAFSLCL